MLYPLFLGLPSHSDVQFPFHTGGGDGHLNESGLKVSARPPFSPPFLPRHSQKPHQHHPPPTQLANHLVKLDFCHTSPFPNYSSCPDVHFTVAELTETSMNLVSNGVLMNWRGSNKLKPLSVSPTSHHTHISQNQLQWQYSPTIKISLFSKSW